MSQYQSSTQREQNLVLAAARRFDVLSRTRADIKSYAKLVLVVRSTAGTVLNAV